MIADPADDVAAFLNSLGSRLSDVSETVTVDGCRITTIGRVSGTDVTLETRLPLDLVVWPDAWGPAPEGEVFLFGADEQALMLPLREAIAEELAAAEEQLTAWRQSETARLAEIHPSSGGRPLHSEEVVADWSAASTAMVARIDAGELGDHVGAFMNIFYGTGDTGEARIEDFALQVPPIFVLPETEVAEFRATLGALQAAACPLTP